MTTLLPEKYLTKKQAVQKYQFLTPNMLKNILSKDICFASIKIACPRQLRLQIAAFHLESCISLCPISS